MSGLDKLRGFDDEHSKYDLWLTDEEVQTLTEIDFDDSIYAGAVLMGVIGQVMRQFTSLNVDPDQVYTYVYKPDETNEEL